MAERRRRLGPRFAAYAIAVLAFLGPATGAAETTIQDFHGVWVGDAVSRNLETGAEEQRDITTEIKKHRRGGFQVHRVAVILVDGKRAAPGVKRRVTEQVFAPAEDGTFYVEIPKPNPFKEAEEMRAIDGDAVRWASLDGNHLLIYSFAVLDDGRFEMQTLDSALDGDRLTIRFQRVMDGEVVVDLQGTAVRVE